MRQPIGSSALFLLLLFACALNANAEEKITLNFPNADVGEILRYYGELTGKKIIRDDSAVGGVNVVRNYALSKPDAIREVEESLYLGGYILVDSSPDTVSAFGPTFDLQKIKMATYHWPEEVPNDGRVISYVFNMRDYSYSPWIGLLLRHSGYYFSFVCHPWPDGGELTAIGPTSSISRAKHAFEEIEGMTPVSRPFKFFSAFSYPSFFRTGGVGWFNPGRSSAIVLAVALGLGAAGVIIARRRPFAISGFQLGLGGMIPVLLGATLTTADFWNAWFHFGLRGASMMNPAEFMWWSCFPTQVGLYCSLLLLLVLLPALYLFRRGVQRKMEAKFTAAAQ